MMSAPEETDVSSPSLVELAVYVRSSFRPDKKTGKVEEKAILKAEEVARTYFTNNEKITAAELEVLYEILRELGIVAVHVPAEFHIHVANVVRCLEIKDKNVTRSHVAALIFSRI